MNGRIYDPTIGRFLSADPIIQAPFNSQSYNRYSYVWNNPLSMVDPSGFLNDDPQTQSACEINHKCDIEPPESELEEEDDTRWLNITGMTLSEVQEALAKARKKGYVPSGNLIRVPANQNNPPKAIVLHRTGGSSAMGAIRAMKKNGLGVHFIVDKDGTIYIMASLDSRPWHVGKIRARCMVETTCSASEAATIGVMGWAPTAISRREASLKAYPSRYPTSAESIGIEVVGSYNMSTKTWGAATAAQLSSINRIVRGLQSAYGLTNKDVYRHDVISYKTPGEGAGLGY